LKVSFAKDTTQSDNGTQPVEVVGGVPATLQPVAPPAPAQIAFDDESAAGWDQIQIPGLFITQKVGKLAEVHDPGDVIHKAGDLTLRLHRPDNEKKGVKGTPPLEIIVLGLPTNDSYSEKVEGGFGGRFFRSKEEVIAAGGVLDYATAKATGKPQFESVATALVLVRKPDDVKDDSSFSEEIDGVKYALCLWRMKGGSYTSGAKPLRTAKTIGILKGKDKKWSDVKWSLTTTLKDYSTGNSAWVPVIKPNVETSPTTREAATALLAALSGK